MGRWFGCGAVVEMETGEKPEDALARFHRENLEKAEAKVAEYAIEDAAEREDAKAWAPPVSVRTYPAGAFLCCDQHELPARHIASITVVTPGHAPRVEYGIGAAFAAKGEARACITMAGGSTHVVDVSRWKLDALLDALHQAWKGCAP